MHADGVAVNVLSPSGLVPTPGVVHHHLDQLVPADLHEPVEVMAEAAHALCSGDPGTLTSRVAFSQPLLAELGLSVPTGPELLSIAPIRPVSFRLSAPAAFAQVGARRDDD